LGIDVVRRALAEDRAREDVTTQLFGSLADRLATGRFIAEERCVVAGMPIAGAVFQELESAARLEECVAEGSWVEAGTEIARVLARSATLLGGERVALNFLQRLSGIATQTRRAVEAVAGTDSVITDTRKTTPGLRDLEKYAVRMGGAANHRGSLADAVLFKDNHWVMLGGGALIEALRRAPRGVAVMVEVETPAQLEAALAAGVTRILVDNQPPAQLAEWVRRAGPDVAIEASGGITPDRARAYAEAGAKFISMGALTHSVRAVAIRLELSTKAAG
jgi:nicotinate-nucleotide pyrophosphorylase (carboxylating)